MTAKIAVAYSLVELMLLGIGSARADVITATGTSTYTTISEYTTAAGSTVTQLTDPITSAFWFSQEVGSLNPYGPPRIGNYIGLSSGAATFDLNVSAVFNSFLLDVVGLNATVATFQNDPNLTGYSYLNAARYFDPGQPVIETASFGNAWQSTILSDGSFSYFAWGGRSVTSQINQNNLVDPSAYAATPFSSSDIVDWVNHGIQLSSDALSVDKCPVTNPDACERYSIVLLGSTSISASVTSIPEPSTWAMMLTALAVFGFVMRRTRRRVTLLP